MGSITAMWWREVKKNWRSKQRVIGSLGQPILFLVVLGLGLGPVFKAAGQGNYIDFLVPGVIAMSIIFTGMFGGISVIWDRQFGFLKETLVTPVSRWKIMLGRTLGGATNALIQGIVVFLIALLIGYRPYSALALILALIFMFLIAILFTALGTAISSRMTDMQAFPLIMNFIVMPLFFLSGALFPLNDLPVGLSIITKINPLTYGVDGIRATLAGISQFPLALDLIIIIDIVVIIFGIGTYMFSKIEV